jgi:hypothetical protein
MREELRESSHYPDRASTCRKSRFGFRARLAAAEKFRKSIGGQPVLDKCLRGVRKQLSFKNRREAGFFGTFAKQKITASNTFPTGFCDIRS